MSVLLAAYESHDTLVEAIESALAQTVPDLEVIVVDDGSEPPLAPVVESVGDARVRLIRHRRNRGLSAARNTALAAARAPYVSQLDHDDAWAPGYLEAILPCFDDPAIGLAYANVEIVGHPTGHDTYIFDPSVHPMDSFPKLAEQNPVPSLTATMRTDAVRAVGGYATWLWAAQDYYLYLKLAAAGWRFAYVDRKLARYRWPEPTRGMSFNARKVEVSELRMWVAFALRHPLTPGPRHQARIRLHREASRLISLASGR